MKNMGGRPPLSEEDLKLLLHKLAPHLQAGQSIETACNEEKISPSTVFKKMNEYDWFMEEINRFKNYKKILYGNIRLMQLKTVSDKVINNKPLSKDEWSFLNWLGENDKVLTEQYGSKNQQPNKKDEKQKDFEHMVLDDPKVLKTVLEINQIFAQRMNDQKISPNNTSSLHTPKLLIQ